MKPWMIWFILFGISLCLTFPGLDQGLNHIPEDVRRVSIAVDIANSGNLNPNWFGHPATFLIYILAAFYKFVNLFSIKGTPFDQYLLNPEPFFLFGRILSRFAAATSVILTYKLANKFLNKKWAFAAAIFTASNPLFVMHAHRVRSDHILTCFLLLGTFVYY